MLIIIDGIRWKIIKIYDENIFTSQSLKLVSNTMDTLKKVQFFLKNKLSQRIIIDEHFNKLLRCLYIFGFITQNNSKRRFMSIVFYLIFMNIYFGCWKALLESLKSKKFVDSLLAMAITLRITSVISECASVVFHQSLIISIVDKLYELNNQDNAILKTFRDLCSKLIKAYTLILVIISACLVIVNVFFNREFHTIIPAFFNRFGHPYVNFFLSFAQFFIFVSIVISLDLMPIISVLKVEALVATLCDQLKHLTSTNLPENEKKLKKCIKLHIKIIS